MMFYPVTNVTNVTLLNRNDLSRYTPPLQIGSDPLHSRKVLMLNGLRCCINVIVAVWAPLSGAGDFEPAIADCKSNDAPKAASRGLAAALQDASGDSNGSWGAFFRFFSHALGP